MKGPFLEESNIHINPDWLATIRYPQNAGSGTPKAFGILIPAIETHLSHCVLLGPAELDQGGAGGAQ